MEGINSRSNFLWIILVIEILIGYVTTLQADSGSFLHFLHSPRYISLKQLPPSTLASLDLEDITSAALGFSVAGEFHRDGIIIKQGNLFHRPKANLLVTLLSLHPVDIDIKKIASYPLQVDGIPNFENLIKDITSSYHDSETQPLILEIGSEFESIHTSNIFKKLPKTLYQVKELVGQGDALIEVASSLNSSKTSDAIVLGEVLVLQEIIHMLSESKASLSDNVPDVFSLTLSGLKFVQEEYGVDSQQASDASRLLVTTLSKVVDFLVNAYDDDVLVELAAMSEPDSRTFRVGNRVLLQEPTTTAAPSPVPLINLQPARSDEFTTIFQTTFWLFALMIVAVAISAHLLWHMDPGDTIIYRMTNQRIKAD